ncbi:hypothetical protein chiPu_0028489, partial [Chiloscyllium punctatum]|nr:hypothetical protein [Chiloscyllium punctatum]
MQRLRGAAQTPHQQKQQIPVLVNSQFDVVGSLSRYSQYPL